MKKVIYAALAATMALGAVTTASATSYHDCQALARFGASSGTLASHCKQFIPSQGLISGGKHEGQEWGKVFKDINFGTEVNHIKVDKKSSIMDPGGKRITYIYQTNTKQDAIKTKKISGWNWLSYKSQVGGITTPVWGE